MHTLSLSLTLTHSLTHSLTYLLTVKLSTIDSVAMKAIGRPRTYLMLNEVCLTFPLFCCRWCCWESTYAGLLWTAWANASKATWEQVRNPSTLPLPSTTTSTTHYTTITPIHHKDFHYYHPASISLLPSTISTTTITTTISLVPILLR